MVLKRGHFEKQIRNNCKVLNAVLIKDGYSERVRNEELIYRVKEDGNILPKRKKEG